MFSAVSCDPPNSRNILFRQGIGLQAGKTCFTDGLSTQVWIHARVKCLQNPLTCLSAGFKGILCIFLKQRRISVLTGEFVPVSSPRCFWALVSKAWFICWGTQEKNCKSKESDSAVGTFYRRSNGYRWKSGQAGLGMQLQLSQNKESTAKVRARLRF